MKLEDLSEKQAKDILNSAVQRFGAKSVSIKPVNVVWSNLPYSLLTTHFFSKTTRLKFLDYAESYHEILEAMLEISAAGYDILLGVLMLKYDLGIGVRVEQKVFLPAYASLEWLLVQQDIFPADKQ